MWGLSLQSLHRLWDIYSANGYCCLVSLFPAQGLSCFWRPCSDRQSLRVRRKWPCLGTPCLVGALWTWYWWCKEIPSFQIVGGIKKYALWQSSISLKVTLVWSPQPFTTSPGLRWPYLSFVPPVCMCSSSDTLFYCVLMSRNTKQQKESKIRPGEFDSLEHLLSCW